MSALKHRRRFFLSPIAVLRCIVQPQLRMINTMETSRRSFLL